LTTCNSFSFVETISWTGFCFSLRFPPTTTPPPLGPVRMGDVLSLFLIPLIPFFFCLGPVPSRDRRRVLKPSSLPVARGSSFFHVFFLGLTRDHPGMQLRKGIRTVRVSLNERWVPHPRRSFFMKSSPSPARRFDGAGAQFYFPRRWLSSPFLFPSLHCVSYTSRVANGADRPLRYACPNAILDSGRIGLLKLESG